MSRAFMVLSRLNTSIHKGGHTMTETEANYIDALVDAAFSEIEKEKAKNGGVIPMVDDPVGEWVDLMKAIL